MEMKCEVFISYSSEDAEVANAVCNKLEGSGVKCWIAPRDIMPGETYSKAIIHAIRTCRIMVFVFSSTSNNSEYVMRELDSAVDEKTIIIPFRIEDILPSDSIKFLIKAAHWLDAFPGPSAEHYDALIKTVKMHLDRECVDDRDAVLTEPGGDIKTGLSGKEDAQIPVSKDRSQASKLNEYEKGLQLLGDLLKQKHWMSCVRKCGAILEKAMKQLLKDLLDSNKESTFHETVMEVQDKTGKGESSYKHFELPQLIDFYRNASIFDELRKHLTSNLHKTKKIDWDKIAEWHDVSKHPGGTPNIDEGDAMQMLYWTKIFLYDCELAGSGPRVSPVSEDKRALGECPYCEEPLQKDWNFCPECGVALKVTCEACHRVLAPDFRICPYCETPVSRRGFGEADSIQKAREEYRVLCVGTYLDGVMNIRERHFLDSKRLELGLTAEEAERIERQCAPENIVEYTRLVEGVLVDGIITDDERTFLKKKAKELDLDDWITGQIEEVVTEAIKETIGNL
jgi:hypothetical protein